MRRDDARLARDAIRLSQLLAEHKAEAVAAQARARRKHVDETCPISTEGWTRRVHFVREGGGGGGPAGSLLGGSLLDIII